MNKVHPLPIWSPKSILLLLPSCVLWAIRHPGPLDYQFSEYGILLHLLFLFNSSFSVIVECIIPHTSICALNTSRQLGNSSIN
ncbi:hypothetical protein BDZ91DRAFT_708995 [Kalaharituber pfeilii]|nr:hypothetical protein BDZ91DRAFT_708995 [Kalaharituber pfeilii]